MVSDFLVGVLGEVLVKLILGAIAAAILGLIAVYIYSAFALMAIAKKTRTTPLWFAWVPILNVVLVLKMAKIKWTWVFALFLILIPVMGKMLIAAGIVYVWWKICKHMHKPEWYAILMIVPLVNLIVLGYLAWGK
ncbi:MAG: hypothetical protein AABW88_02885 [Nanoarchaeota archaeon]